MTLEYPASFQDGLPGGYFVCRLAFGLGVAATAACGLAFLNGVIDGGNGWASNVLGVGLFGLAAVGLATVTLVAAIVGTVRSGGKSVFAWAAAALVVASGTMSAFMVKSAAEIIAAI